MEELIKNPTMEILILKSILSAIPFWLAVSITASELQNVVFFLKEWKNKSREELDKNKYIHPEPLAIFWTLWYIVHVILF